MKVGDLLTPVSDFFCHNVFGFGGDVGSNAQARFGVACIQKRCQHVVVAVGSFDEELGLTLAVRALF